MNSLASHKEQRIREDVDRQNLQEFVANPSCRAFVHQ